MKMFVTGGAGFIGSNFVNSAVQSGHRVTVFDNFSTGSIRNLEAVKQSIDIVEGDLLDYHDLAKSIADHDAVFHFAANADVRGGIDNIGVDLEQNVIATHNVLKAMHKNGVLRLTFSSTAVVVGEPEIFPTPEDLPMPKQTSFYGASKMSAEGFISAFCTAFGLEADVFRFVSVVGRNYSHGHVYDFVKKLKANPKHLEILGDGSQTKSVVHVDDLIDAIWLTLNRRNDGANKSPFDVYNVGTNETFLVHESAGWICDEMALSPEFSFTGGARGWVGDQPKVFLDIARLKSIGWQPKYSVEQAIRNTCRWLLEND